MAINSVQTEIPMLRALLRGLVLPSLACTAGGTYARQSRLHRLNKSARRTWNTATCAG